uniref:Calcineurin-like phosphoesterase domain-containing protein n=1 Tax=Timema shepardi TaxID=629360 RepID=A0A7R9G234_TIMSH|nr:unnamed protein product [Timema shepardi]
MLTFFSIEREKVFQEPFYFIQGADIQLGLIQRYIEKNPVPGWSKELQLAELAIKKVNAMRPKPKFFVMCGDLCDAMPCKLFLFYYDMPLIRQKQEIDFKQVFYKLDPGIPLVCVCGNHDVGDQPTEDSIEAYHKSFGEDYFSFWCGGVMFIVINSQYLYDSSQVKKQAEDHELWLSNTLQTARKYCVKRVIVFQHIPWFLHDPKENNLESYFTLPQDVRNKWLPILKQSGYTHLSLHLISRVELDRRGRGDRGSNLAVELNTTSALANYATESGNVLKK